MYYFSTLVERVKETEIQIPGSKLLLLLLLFVLSPFLPLHHPCTLLPVKRKSPGLPILGPGGSSP